jgi:alpha-glucosidase (family GH31 glycosyl hydrolase)
MSAGVPVAPEGAVGLCRGPLSVDVVLRPFSLTLRRDGRRLLRSAGLWAAEGIAADHFVQLTEGVIVNETLAPYELAASATVVVQSEDTVVLRLRLRGARQGSLQLHLAGGDRLVIEAEFEDGPLRLAMDWDTRSDERFVGLGARHAAHLDQAGRMVQLGADRRYTGPDCPAELLAQGGIPQADCAPVPWVISSRGYAVWAETHGNGTRFELGDERVAVSTRADAGPLRVHVVAARTPAACLRAYCGLTGFPPVLPEWGYGFWKSRDVYEHQSDVEEDFAGFTRHKIALDAIVLDSPWETQYNTWEFNPHQFPDAAGLIARMRRGGVHTVVWVTPWVNLDSRDGQVPPDPGSQRLHREPATNYAPAATAGHFVRRPNGAPFVARWWMGTGSPVDFTSPAAEQWWRESAKRVLALGVEGIKADDGEGYYFPDDVRFADGRSGAQAAWAYGALYRDSMQRALNEAHPGRGVLFGRSGWSGQQATGMLWGGDQASDFWSLGVLVTATLAAACSAMSNWSHDVGGYLGHRLVERCPPELLVRWVQFGCFTPLMHAHGRMPQEPWTYGEDVLDLYRAYVLLHERLVPYVRAAAATAARTGLPIIRPLCLTDPRDPRGWAVTDAYGYGPALWVAPVLDDGAREREVVLPRGRWVEAWSGREVPGGEEVIAPAPVHAIPVWVRAGSIVVTHPKAHVERGLGDADEARRPLEATLWGEPELGRAAARLADGTRIRWRRGSWSVDRDREVTWAER